MDKKIFLMFLHLFLSKRCLGVDFTAYEAKWWKERWRHDAYRSFASLSV